MQAPNFIGLAALEAAGYSQTFTDEEVSGAVAKRPALTRCFKARRPPLRCVNERQDPHGFALNLIDQPIALMHDQFTSA